MGYVIHLVTQIGIFVILALSYNFILGLGRLFSLAHVAAYAIGAYTTAILGTWHGYGFFTCALLSVLTSCVLSFLMAAISLKLTEEYFAIGTLAFSALVSALLINWKSLTNGVLGIAGIPSPTVFGHEIVKPEEFCLLVLAVCEVVTVVLRTVYDSPFVRSVRAQAESDIIALSMGRNTTGLRTITLVIGSGAAGVAGTLFAYFLKYIDPSSFTLTEMVFILTIVIVGRPGSFVGVVLSTVFLVLMPESLRFLDIVQRVPGILGPLRQLMYALVLFGVVFAFRHRMFPLKRKV